MYLQLFQPPSMTIDWPPNGRAGRRERIIGFPPMDPHARPRCGLPFTTACPFRATVSSWSPSKKSVQSGPTLALT